MVGYIITRSSFRSNTSKVMACPKPKPKPKTKTTSSSSSKLSAVKKSSCSASTTSTADVTETTTASASTASSSRQYSEPLDNGYQTAPAHLSVPAGGGDFPPISFRLWDRYNRLRGLDDTLTSVALPRDEFLAGWVAVHLVDFYRDVASAWDVIVSDMSSRMHLRRFRPGEGYPPGAMYYLEGGGGGGGGPPPALVSAPVYAAETLLWIERRVMNGRRDDANHHRRHLALDEDEERRVYRACESVDPRFAVLSGKILRRLFRVYGILHRSMPRRRIERLRLGPHLDGAFERFAFFCFEFGLLSKREMDPLGTLVEPVLRRYRIAKEEERRSPSPARRVQREDVSVASSGGTLERAPFVQSRRGRCNSEPTKGRLDVRLLHHGNHNDDDGNDNNNDNNNNSGDLGRMSSQEGQEVVLSLSSPRVESTSTSSSSQEEGESSFYDDDDELGFSSHGSPVIGKHAAPTPPMPTPTPKPRRPHLSSF